MKRSVARPALRRFRPVAAGAVMACLAIAGPTRAWAGSGPARGPFFYRVIASFGVDVDRMIADATGLEAERCRFVDARTGRAEEYSGLGGCLYRSFVASTETDAVPGTVSAVLRAPAPAPRTIPAEFVWRPARMGWWSTLWNGAIEYFGLAGRAPRFPIRDVLGSIEARFPSPGLRPSEFQGAIASAIARAATPEGAAVSRLRLWLEASVGSDDPSAASGWFEAYAEGRERPFLRSRLAARYALFRSGAAYLRGETEAEGEAP